MSHSTHVGFSAPPTAAFRGIEFREDWDGPPLFAASCVVGVGHIPELAMSRKPICLLTPRAACLSISLFNASADLPLWLSHAPGVGKNPDTITSVASANGGSRYAMPLRIIPERGQVSENVSKPPTKQCCDVFHDDEAGSYLANKPCVFAP